MFDGTLNVPKNRLSQKKSKPTLMRRLLLCLCFVIPFSYPLTAQIKLQGIVKNQLNEPLAFVTVALEADTPGGVLTDLEGRFQLLLPRNTKAIQFRYLGYKTLRIEPAFWQDKKLLQIELQPEDFSLPEVQVRPGENKANILMRKVIAARDANNPEKQNGYRCMTYNKNSFDLLPNRKVFEKSIEKKDSSSKSAKEQLEHFNTLEKSSTQHHLFLMESVTERSFLAPNSVQEKVLLNRVSGASYAGLVAVANALQPFTFYGDYLQIIDKDFVNPISPGSIPLYFFNLEDTLFQGRDTLWTVSFRPRKGKVFTALEGVFHINSDGYAVQNVQAWPAETGNMEIKIQQSYKRMSAENKKSGQARQWFPEQLDFELVFRKYPAEHVGIKAVGRSYISDAIINPVLQQRDFNPDKPLLMLENAHSQPDSAWAYWRSPAPLSNKELRTYTWLDSLGKKKRIGLLFNVMDYLNTGLFPILGPVNLDINNVLRFSEYEDWRLGIGLSTAQARSLEAVRRVEASIYAGYGFRDKGWKYGGQALWRINRNTGTSCSAGWRNDLQEPGALPGTSRQYADRFVYAKKVDRIQEAWVAVESRLGRPLLLQGKFSRQDISPQYGYAFQASDGSQHSSFRFAEASISLRFAYNEERRRFLGNETGSVQHWPVLELSYSRGLPQVFGGTYSYNRWVGTLYQSIFIRRLGRCSWRLEAGQVDPAVPLAKLFTLNQSPDRGAFSYIALRNTFQALPDTLFASDQFVNLYFSQELGPVLYKSRHSSPFLTVHQNIAWGRLRSPERHLETGLQSAEKVFYETGLQLDNLVRLNYLNFATIGFGTALYYQWGPLQNPNWQDNVTIRLALKFQL
jgi:Family of unknown function (DUF5686)/CarboxypepD_reg-like domain